MYKVINSLSNVHLLVGVRSHFQGVQRAGPREDPEKKRTRISIKYLYCTDKLIPRSYTATKQNRA